DIDLSTSTDILDIYCELFRYGINKIQSTINTEVLMMNQEQAKSFLKEIIQIKSINPPGNEAAVAKRLKAFFDDYGIATELVEYDKNRTNLIARLKGEHDGPVRGLTGHMDVVPPGEGEGSYDPFAAQEVEGKVYGRGGCDMKGGLVACALAIASLKKAGLPKKGEVIF